MGSTVSRRAFLKLLALLPLLEVYACQTVGGTNSQSQNREMPNVLILVFDALSARHMSLYGYSRETTPNLARFAERATVYHAHYAAGNFTSPGVPSILTGTYPWTHRAFHVHGAGIVGKRYARKNLFSAFAEQGYHTFAYSHNHNVTTQLHYFSQSLDLFERIRDLCLADDEVSDLLFMNDYDVAFWSEWDILHDTKSPTSSLFLSLLNRSLGNIRSGKLAQEYEHSFARGRGLPNLHTVTFVLEHAIDWVMAQVNGSPQPFLGYVHVLPPHDPYITRKDFQGIFRDGWVVAPKPTHFFSMGVSNENLYGKRRKYDEYIAYADAEFGRLYDFMLQTGVLEHTYVVITSDHGEMFERGIWGHLTETLYEAVIRVPLLISKPGQRQREDVYVATSCVDLLPTLLYAIHQSASDWCEGQVLPTFGYEGDSDQRIVFSVEAKNNPIHSPLVEGTVALIRGEYKLIHYFGYPGHENVYELYDLTSDPEELEDLSSKSVAAELRSELEKKLNEVDRPYIRE